MSSPLRETPPLPRQHAREAPPPAASDEIDLLDYARAVWRHRYILLAVALVAGIVTYVYNRTLTPTYQAEFRLMASEPRLTDGPAQSLGMAAFRELAQTRTLAATVVEEFRLNQPPHNLTADRFVTRNVDVEVLRDSTIVRVAIRLTDRDLLVKVANRYADLVVAASQRLTTDSLDYTVDRIRRERDAALQNLTTAEKALEDYRRRTQIEVLRKDVETMLERRPEALDLMVQIQGERARIRQGESELAKLEQVRTVRRSLDSLPAAERTATPRKTTPPSGEQPPTDLKIRSDLLDPYVNPVYEALERDVTDARTRLAGLQQKRQELVSRLQLDKPTAEKLTRLYEAETGLAAITRQHEVARAAYINAANKYEDARLQITARSPRLAVLDAALPPDRPVAPRPLRNTLTAILIVLTIAAVAVLALDASRRPKTV